MVTDTTIGLFRTSFNDNGMLNHFTNSTKKNLELTNPMWKKRVVLVHHYTILCLYPDSLPKYELYVHSSSSE